MSTEQHDVTLRPITGRDELDLFCQLPYVLNDELADDLDAGRRRPHWMWLALRDGRVVARAAWWSPGETDPPLYLDVFDMADDPSDHERTNVAERLLRTAMADVLPAGSIPPEYLRFVPPDWRDEDATRRGVEDRMLALERTGARLLVERLRLQWRAGTPLADPSRRLVFRTVDDSDELVDLMTSTLDGTLDAHGRADLNRMSARSAAVRHYTEELARYSSPRAWWRIATLPDGEPVGFVIPARNPYHPIIAYLGVLPAHRGNGYIDDILAEGTRILAQLDVPRIRASTDLGNTPMAAAFHRAGYVTFERTIAMTWS
ncbi:MAG: GNAT family N-acetyltransferase [Micromonosporaceae bacterium]